MTLDRLRAAVIGSLMSDPTSELNRTCRELGVDGAWQLLTSGRAIVPPWMVRRIAALHPDDVLQRARRSGARLLLPDDPAWPPQLRDLGAAEPWALWVRGPGLDTLLDRRSVAIVGARACTHDGRRVASEFAAGIARHGNAVVSGGAIGIDGAAHLGALAVDGVTVAVLASGVDVPYPAEHADLLERIAVTGALVSEALPGSGVTRPAFLVRNRLIAALAYGTVVVEARLRSGSISTYAHARALHRVGMAVPGSVLRPEHAGSNALLQSDAALVTSAEDVLSLVEPLGAVAVPEPTAPLGEWDDLDLDERAVHEALPSRGSCGIATLLERAELPGGTPAILAALAMLQHRGLVAEEVDGTWRRVRALRGAAT